MTLLSHSSDAFTEKLLGQDSYGDSDLGSGLASNLRLSNFTNNRRRNHCV